MRPYESWTPNWAIAMTEIAAIVLPVFVLAAMGYASVWTGLLKAPHSDALAAFVFNVAIPLLLFRSLATADYPAGSPFSFWGTYLSGILVAWFGAMAIVRFIWRRGWRASVIAGVAGSFSNLVLVGIPLIERAYGQAGLTLHFVLIAVHLPFMMTLSTFLMEFAARADGADNTPVKVSTIASHLARNLAVNPIIIGIAAGSAWHLTGLDVPAPALSIIDLLARTAGPLALFSLGMSLVTYSIRGNWQPAIGIAALSVFVMPAVVLFVGSHLFDLPPLWLKVAVIAAACPTGVNAYLFATYFNRAHGLASSSIVFAALGSIVALPFWLSVMAGY